MKLVVVTSRFPYPLEKGDKLRLYFQIKYLAQRHEITLLSLADEPVSEDSLNHINSFCNSVHIFPIKKNRAKWNALKSLITNTPLEVNYFFNNKIKRRFEEIIHQVRPDHIYCQLIRMSEFVRNLPYPKTLDYMDAFSIGMQRRAENSNPITKAIFKRDATKIAKYESVVYHDFDNHTIISEQDRKHLAFFKNEKIHVLPNGVDTHFFAPMPQVKKSFNIAFVGNMGYYPNIQAALFLAKKIIPKLLEKFPDIKLLIAGARPTQEIKNLACKNIYITGWVEDIRSAYASANIFVAPIFYGRGQQNKILEAMSMGIPCITSDQVNQAIGAKDGTSILIANDDESCQEQISLLLTDEELQKKLSKNGLDWIRNNFSWEKYGKQLEDLIV
ncbi:glycosyltransferase [Saprospiraceae bacterium]|nr:glycosyltransferase [Saprospiraceae bacterium]MDC3219965.1 glycosyltransferase [Saprospiraceae bacterium]